MKKLIQVFSFLSLVIVFSIVSANAQTVKQYAAEIPFDFSIDQKSYQAGSYVIKVSKFSQSSIALSLEDKENHVLQTIFVSANGDVAKNEPKLSFTVRDNQRFLTKIAMQDMGLTIPVNERQDTAKAKRVPEVAAHVKTEAVN
ncbi:MAG TPA: hypothetical protein VK308_17535 [Pyrinomonadaceae bacterium]|nr:hypothetical protein [Pyrinomonadaceae bacterium]